jgi:hypothetical protein
MLKQKMPTSSASFISAAVLPTPEKTTFFGSAPAASTRCNSPPETMSNPAPRRAKMFRMARLELALTA